MSTDEQPSAAGGSVPHAFRTALFWRWTRDMPRGLPASFVTLLYALGSAANPSGQLRFRDGKAVRIKDIAAAAKTDEKDVRRYIDAAIAAGVLAVEGERRRGRSALYVLVLSPRPDWGAAASALGASKRKRPERKPPPWRTDENGAPPPVLPDAENGGPPPELSEPENGAPPPVLDTPEPKGERGPAPRMGSGDRPPFGSGDRPPNNPGVTQGVTQGVVTSPTQPDTAAPPDSKTINGGEDDAGERASPPPRASGPDRCRVCHRPMVRRIDGRDTHTHCRPENGDAA